MDEIRFYKVNDPYGFFSNFSPHPIFVDGEVWRTVEHYFQASKFSDNKVIDRIKSIESPMKVALEGRSVKNVIKADWEMIRESVMKKALTAKFLQHPDLRNSLLGTGDKLLIEDTSNDSYWGNGGDGSGKNRLGELLMEVRGRLHSFCPDGRIVLPPWIAFPEVSQFDMFWRMGPGEDYLMEWSKYYLSVGDKNEYKNMFPPEGDWGDVYD